MRDQIENKIFKVVVVCFVLAMALFWCGYLLAAPYATRSYVLGLVVVTAGMIWSAIKAYSESVGAHRFLLQNKKGLYQQMLNDALAQKSIWRMVLQNWFTQTERHLQNRK